MSLSLATKGTGVNAAISLATKGVIYRAFGVAFYLLTFRARVSDVANLVATTTDRDTILSNLTDTSAEISVIDSRYGIVAILSDSSGSTVLTDTRSIRAILNAYSTIVTQLGDQSAISILTEAGAFSQVRDRSPGASIQDVGGRSEASDN